MSKIELEKLQLDESVIERLRLLIINTWNVIGGDILEATNRENIELTNESAIETVIDANYIETHIGDKEAQTLINNLCEKYDVVEVIEFLAEHIKLN